MTRTRKLLLLALYFFALSVLPFVGQENASPDLDAHNMVRIVVYGVGGFAACLSLIAAVWSSHE